METSSPPPPNPNVPVEFVKIMNEFITDIRLVFPEYAAELSGIDDIGALFPICIQTFTPHFMNILQRQDVVFQHNLIPCIPLLNIWNTPEISDSTRECIWKYLQAISSITILHAEHSDLGDSASQLFESLDPEFLQKGITEMLKSLNNNKDDSDDNTFTTFFNNLNNMVHDNLDEDNEEKEGNNEGNNEGSKGDNILPTPDSIFEHIQNMMKGKLGRLASRLAEELSQEMHLEGTETKEDVIKNLISNPAQLASMAKKMGSALEQEMKNGNITEEDIQHETSEMMKNMKDIPGIGNIIKQMGNFMGNNGTAESVQSEFGKRVKYDNIVQRLKAKQKSKKAAAAAATATAQQQQQQQQQSIAMTDDEIAQLFGQQQQTKNTNRNNNRNKSKK